MKRAFSSLSSRLLKSESDELKSTIEFLAKGSKRPTLSSLLDRRTSSNGNLSRKDESKHVERVLKILNSSLPEVDSKKKRVQAHYDILFSQLKDIAQQSWQKPFQNIPDNSSRQYEYLMLQQYMGKLQSIPQLAKILLSKNFQDFNRLWENRMLFDDKQQLHLSVLLYYRCRNPRIREEFEDKWLEQFKTMHISVQRLFWRCLTRENADIIQVIEETRSRMVNWTAHDTVVLYQSLYASAHLLPIPEESLSRNQQLFITTLRILASHNLGKKWMVKLVKMSTENRLANENSAESMTITIYQYRFIRGLDLALQEVYSSCEGKRFSAELQQELQEVMASANNEEQEIKSQMSLKFI